MYALRRPSHPRTTRSRAGLRSLAAGFTAAAVLGLAGAGQAETSPGLWIYDVAWVRPISAIHLVAGSVMCVPAVILAAPGGTTRDAFNTYIGLPLHELTQRPLGEF